MAVPFPDEAPGDGTDARLLAEAAPGDNVPPLSVSQLSAAIKRTVEDGFARVRVRGELSGAKRAASGHFYAALKDDNALIDMVMWKGQAARLAFRPEDGIEVIATGKLTTYPGRSKYQLVVESLEVAGEGALMLLFEKLKARLGGEGLFDRDRKQPLPYLPRTIGVVTSPTGAVIRDILHRLADRCPSHVIVWPVLVQGEGAAAQVAAAIRGFDALAPGGKVARPDLVIVARGGGSIEDLWAFNEEVVVRAIADCRIPTISAVGHETDVTLADYAADMRAPTPTAAAEMAVPVRAELQAQLATWGGRMIGAANRQQALRGERLTALARHLPRRDALYAPQRQRLDDVGERLGRGQRQRLAMLGERLGARGAALRPALLARAWDRDRAKLDGLGRLLASLDPRALLSRGYAMVRDAGGAIVTSAAKARDAGHLRLQFADGELPVTVGEGGDPAPSSGPRPARKASPSAPKAGQGELF
ncbi:exodeoxyribonuclease VII large subunit [Sphingopyxis alaskensis]|uniref:Exodeoxyribonuclease 7 large subunit n=1 Tax=Sphingopyxis alaskensis (strain DSM 13593 / LMG 18877 / RB2256) TaxID=317655 RepID=Q1GNG3_SPHAL|nr:exodeoxyribonuclease VII large subunit [Sphingopyxis alaskensis]ABF54809.1 Exodeoxyribonuclease VII large subunit [Sphingopyxis alaskensis RB2256]MCM3421140.1 exodeoxyribonuclease VII large subunit [Sphingopyxis alaskensis]